ncbi:hypothetical protein G4B88_020603 [Cannabis sativa]|uniref:Uncharacterized protein n=1 Tax=Cannabis sativa TaxID=3483 RepID=A0A7J6EMX6_CANSA|nr:hypothetical protein G4B88_020603 [Cannabis sativa]
MQIMTVSVNGVCTTKNHSSLERGGVRPRRRRCLLRKSVKIGFSSDSILRSCGSTTTPLRPHINSFLSDSSSSFPVPYSRSKPGSVVDDGRSLYSTSSSYKKNGAPSKSVPRRIMASPSQLTNCGIRESGRDLVYVAAFPLRAAKGPPQLLMSAAYSLNLWDFQHFVVIIKPHSPPPHSQVLVYDFQPKDPENIFVALEVLSGRSIPGVVLIRNLSKLPRSNCWFVGSSKVNATAMACEFNKNWGTHLRVGHHDCRDYTNGLVEYLTGEKHVLERLKRSNKG